MTDKAARGPEVGPADAEGFHDVRFAGDGHNAGYGLMQARPEGQAASRVRIPTGERAANLNGSTHGGFLLSFLDQALFVGLRILDRIEVSSAVTLTLSTQFLSAGAIDRPLDCVVEVVRETGRLLFLRGTLEQEGEVLLSYQATLRKIRQG